MSSNFAPEPPPIPQAGTQPPNFKSIGQQISSGVESSGMIERGARAGLRFLSLWLATVISCILHMTTAVLVFFSRIIIKGEEQAEDSMSEVGRTMLSDLLGVNVSKDAMRRRKGAGIRKPEVNELGNIVLRGLFETFDETGQRELQPSDAGAKKVINTVVGMTVEGVVEGAVIDAFSWGLLKPLTDMDDNLARAMGFGRLTTRVVRPAVDILVQTPFEWKLNKQYRPKLLSAAQLAEEVNAGRLEKEAAVEELARQGYSDAKIEALLAQSTKTLSVADVTFLERVGIWTRDDAHATLRQQGYTPARAGDLLDIARLKRIESAKSELESACTTAYINRDIDRETFVRILESVEPDVDVRAWLIQAAGLRREFRIAKLSETDAEQAVKRGIWSIRDYTDYLKDKGFSDGDILTKQLLLQFDIRDATDAATKRQQLEQQRAAEKAARRQAALQRQAELEEQRRHKELTLATVERAYVRGRLTLDQYRDFLVRDEQAPEDIAILLDLAEADRGDYIAAQSRRAAADAKLAATSLTTAQLERAVELGVLTIENYVQILTEQGVSPEEAAILRTIVTTNIAERAAAEARREQIRQQMERRNLSLGQFEHAVKLGARTIADYKQFLREQGFTVEDAELLAALLQASIAEELEARRRRAEIEQRLKNQRISIADMEQAVRRGLRSRQDYKALLEANNIVAADVQTLLQLLAAEMEEEAEQRRRKEEIENRLKVKNISLADLERAVKLGIVNVGQYRAALTRENVPALDQEIMVALLEEEIERMELARLEKQAAEEKLRNRPVPLADLERGVRLGLRSLQDYELELRREGFEDNAVQLLSQLLQEETAQLNSGRQRRAILDRLASPREQQRAVIEAAVRSGELRIGDYDQFLREQGYELLDRISLEQLLRAEMA